VCQEFKRLINDDSLWRSLYHTYWKRDYAFRHCWREAVKQGMLSEENWMTGNHQKLVLRGAHTGPIACIQLNGDTVVSAGADAMLQVWNRRDGGKRVQLRGHTGEVQALELRGNRAISGSADSTIRVWSVYSKDCLKLLAGHQKSIECINVDDNHVVSGSADTTVKLWDLHTGQLMRTWRDHTGVITRVAIRDGGHTLVSASADGDVKLWDSVSGSCIQTLKHPSAVNCLQLRDYNVLSAAKDVIYVWDMRMGRWNKLKSHTRNVLCMHYYEDNRLVSGSLDRTIRVWDLTRGGEEEIGTFEGHKDGVKCIQCDGRRVVSGSNDRTLRIFDLEEGRCLYAFLFPEWITCLAFDESTLAGASSDSTLSLFSFLPTTAQNSYFLG